ncbi:MAG: hypothetical protein K2L54_02455 [Clostridiales bacterium]|nr:hypothetical protein [Clostridiales bacterium]
MKKKLICLLTASALACSMAVAAVACGDDDGGGAKSEKIDSAAAWSAAFDHTGMDNGTVFQAMRTTCNSSQTEYIEYTYKFDGNKQQSIIGYFDAAVGSIVTREHYLKIENDVCYSYEYDGVAEEWYLDIYAGGDPYSIHNRMNGYDSIIGDLTNTDKYLSDRYDEFEYDESSGVYVLAFDELRYEFENAENPETYIYTNINFTVFISGGKVTVGTLRYDTDGEEADERLTTEITFKLTDISSTTVTLPNVEA